MSNIAILYGSILASRVSKYEETGDYPFLSHNIAVLESLPLAEGYPLTRFTRTLFALTSHEPFSPGFFKIPVIHFGGSYKNLDGVWDEWLMNFEGLLRQLYWEQADLHLTLEWPPEGFSERVYHYKWIASDSRKIGEDAWVFSGGPRDFNKRSPSEY